MEAPPHDLQDLQSSAGNTLVPDITVQYTFRNLLESMLWRVRGVLEAQGEPVLVLDR